MKAFLPNESLVPWLKDLSSSLEVIAPVDVEGEAVYQTWKGQLLPWSEIPSAPR